MFHFYNFIIDKQEQRSNLLKSQVRTRTLIYVAFYLFISDGP